MPAPTPELEDTENRVFTTLRGKISMPLLEIAAATELGVEELRAAIDKLAEKNLVTVKGADDPLSAIVTVNQQFL